MRDVVICEPIRTAVGGFGGGFKTVHAHEMASHVIRELMARTKLAPAAVEDCVFAQCYPSTGGYQIDRRCGSGLQAVINGIMQVATGANDLVIAGGAESMSNAPFFSIDMRWNIKGEGLMLHDGLSRGRYTAGGKFHPVPGGMIETAENLRRDYEISRDHTVYHQGPEGRHGHL